VYKMYVSQKWGGGNSICLKCGVMNDLLISIRQNFNLQKPEPTWKLCHSCCCILYDGVTRVFTYMLKILNYAEDNHIHMCIVYKRFEQLNTEWNNTNKEETHQ
jgi:DNA-binding XRE family transcriptional regulator